MSNTRPSNQNGNQKICLLTSVHDAKDVRIFHKEAISLSAAGYDVTIVAPADKNIASNGVRVLAIPREETRLLRMTRAVWRVYKLARRENATVYHFHDPELIPIGILLAAGGRRVIYDVHEDVPKDVLDKDWIPKNLRVAISVVVNLLERLSCRCFSAVITADDDIGRRLSSSAKRLITLNNYPLACEFGESNYLGRQRLMPSAFVNFGGVYSLRAIGPIVDALGLLPPSVPVKLILGGCCESDLLLEELEEKPGWQRVDYRGQMTRSQMLSELSRASGALVLYTNAPNHQTVRSNRFYEAIAAGLPVITPNFGDWPSIVEGGRCGLTVDPENPRDIAAAIKRLCSSPEEAEEMSRNGRDLFLRQFNWDCEGEKLLRLVALLANASTSTRHHS